MEDQTPALDLVRPDVPARGPVRDRVPGAEGQDPSRFRFPVRLDQRPEAGHAVLDLDGQDAGLEGHRDDLLVGDGEWIFIYRFHCDTSADVAPDRRRSISATQAARRPR